MSGWVKCNCGRKQNDRSSLVRISEYYMTNRSYFEYPKGQPHPSDYSLVYCLACWGAFRTKSAYVHTLRMISIHDVDKERKNWHKNNKTKGE